MMLGWKWTPKLFYSISQCWGFNRILSISWLTTNCPGRPGGMCSTISKLGENSMN